MRHNPLNLFSGQFLPHFHSLRHVNNVTISTCISLSQLAYKLNCSINHFPNENRLLSCATIKSSHTTMPHTKWCRWHLYINSLPCTCFMWGVKGFLGDLRLAFVILSQMRFLYHTLDKKSKSVNSLRELFFFLFF